MEIIRLSNFTHTWGCITLPHLKSCAHISVSCFLPLSIPEANALYKSCCCIEMQKLHILLLWRYALLEGNHEARAAAGSLGRKEGLGFLTLRITPLNSMEGKEGGKRKKIRKVRWLSFWQILSLDLTNWGEWECRRISVLIVPHFLAFLSLSFPPDQWQLEMLIHF